MLLVYLKFRYILSRIMKKKVDVIFEILKAQFYHVVGSASLLVSVYCR